MIRDYIMLITQGWSPLHVAALHQDVDGGKTFLSYGFKLENQTQGEASSGRFKAKWPQHMTVHDVALKEGHTMFISEMEQFQVTLQRENF